MDIEEAIKLNEEFGKKSLLLMLAYPKIGSAPLGELQALLEEGIHLREVCAPYLPVENLELMDLAHNQISQVILRRSSKN